MVNLAEHEFGYVLEVFDAYDYSIATMPEELMNLPFTEDLS